MRNVTKSELFVELNNANQRALQAERKLAAVEAVVDRRQQRIPVHLAVPEWITEIRSALANES